MSVSFDSSSFDAGINRYAGSFLRSAVKGLVKTGEQLKEFSVSKTPVDTGELRSRAFISPVSADGDTLSVIVGYADKSPEYAVIVHERTNITHSVGQAKFLESSLHEIAGKILPLLAEYLLRSSAE